MTFRVTDLMMDVYQGPLDDGRNRCVDTTIPPCLPASGMVAAPAEDLDFSLLRNQLRQALAQ